jgi:hypothetical protein
MSISISAFLSTSCLGGGQGADAASTRPIYLGNGTIIAVGSSDMIMPVRDLVSSKAGLIRKRVAYPAALLRYFYRKLWGMRSLIQSLSLPNERYRGALLRGRSSPWTQGIRMRRRQRTSFFRQKTGCQLMPRFFGHRYRRTRKSFSTPFKGVIDLKTIEAYKRLYAISRPSDFPAEAGWRKPTQVFDLSCRKFCQRAIL